MIRSSFLGFYLFAIASVPLAAQSEAPENWFNLDLTQDKTAGVGTERVYKELLAGKEGAPVIVAIIDSGVDAGHEDLKDVMWVNPGEIPGNGIDDDKNGYVDDINGWNFIGGKDGRNVGPDNLEVARVYGRLRDKFAKMDTLKLSRKERKEFAQYTELRSEIEGKRANFEQRTAQYGGMLQALERLQQELGEDITEEQLEAYETTDPQLGMMKQILGNAMAEGATVPEIHEELEGAFKYFSDNYEYNWNPDFDARSIVGDDYSNSYERGYGNNDVQGPDAFHGTHVAGIVGAKRGNGLGIDGVADNVRIMSVRAVPNGDERDKDVANAIIYAVDNGAKVVNMSFGKGYSWDKEVVDKAVKYAAKHDVLLVHAAGNSAENNDQSDNFPREAYQREGFLKFLKKKYPNNWLEIGALSWQSDADAVATFSNYGKSAVDIFSPGVDIYSTTPGNQYRDASGTSMASPVTAGVAALIRSYFPELKAKEVKEIILTSGTEQGARMVKLPGSETMVRFDSLSESGAIVNAFEAVKLAQKETGRPGGVLANGKIPRA